jgi:hypothetical protein
MPSDIAGRSLSGSVVRLLDQGTRGKADHGLPGGVEEHERQQGEATHAGSGAAQVADE